MNLRTIFKAQAVILLINGLGSLFLTSVFIQQAGWTPTADLITIGQFLGVVFIVNGIWSWRFPDIAAENLKVNWNAICHWWVTIHINYFISHCNWSCGWSHRLYKYYFNCIICNRLLFL